MVLGYFALNNPDNQVRIVHISRQSIILKCKGEGAGRGREKVSLASWIKGIV